MAAPYLAYSLKSDSAAAAALTVTIGSWSGTFEPDGETSLAQAIHAREQEIREAAESHKKSATLRDAPVAFVCKDEGDFDAWISALLAAVVCSYPKDEELAGAIAQYAEQEWRCEPIPWPLHRRLRSQYLVGARSRLFDGEKLLRTLLGNLSCKGLAADPPPPLAALLDRDSAAYVDDMRRALELRGAEIGYAMLPRATDGGLATVEMVRIKNPRSFLFEQWAWQDAERSRSHTGFPLAWIDQGWGAAGTQVFLQGSSGRTLVPLLGLSPPAQPRDRGRSLFWPGDLSVELRCSLKKPLFAANEITVEDFRFCDGQTQSSPTATLSEAIHDSDVDLPAIIPKDPNRRLNEGGSVFRFASIPYSDDVDIWDTWAGDDIARILYSVLRPAPDMRLPNKFLEEHVFRVDGLVATCSRQGVAVAYRRGRGPTPERDPESVSKVLEKTTARMARLTGMLEQIQNSLNAPGKPPFSEEDICKKVEDAVRLHLELRQEMTKPLFRPIRFLMERRQSQEVFDAIRQWQGSVQQQETLDEQRNVLAEIDTGQKKLEVLEVVIVSFYMLEMAQLLGEVVIPNTAWRLTVTMFCGLAAWILAWLFMVYRRKQKTISTKPRTARAEPSDSADKEAARREGRSKRLVLWFFPATLLAYGLMAVGFGLHGPLRDSERTLDEIHRALDKAGNEIHATPGSLQAIGLKLDQLNAAVAAAIAQRIEQLKSTVEAKPPVPAKSAAPPATKRSPE